MSQFTVAVGRSLLVVVRRLLSTPDTRFHDLGSDCYHGLMTRAFQSLRSHTPPNSRDRPGIGHP